MRATRGGADGWLSFIIVRHEQLYTISARTYKPLCLTLPCIIVVSQVGDWTAALHELVARSGIGAECDCQTCTANHLGQSSESHDLQLVVREEGMHDHVIRAADFEHELRPGMFKAHTQAPVLNAAVARNMQAALYKVSVDYTVQTVHGRIGRIYTLMSSNSEKQL